MFVIEDILLPKNIGKMSLIIYFFLYRKKSKNHALFIDDCKSFTKVCRICENKRQNQRKRKEKTQEILSHFKGYKSAYIAEDLIKIIHFVCVSCTNV